MTTVLLLFSSSNIGGAERSLSRMALSNKDPKVVYQLATFGAPGQWSTWVYELGANPECFDFRWYSLLKYLVIKKPDVIYVIGFRLSFVLRFFKIFFRKSFLIQGVRWNPNSNSILDKVFRISEYFFSFCLDGFIVNSNIARQNIERLTNQEVKLIYNGLEGGAKRRNVLVQNKTVITVANISERKGYRDYLDVIAIVVKTLPDSQFVFIGSDNLNGEIHQHIIAKGLNENVKPLGFQANVGEFLVNSQLFVLPSQYGEGCPTSILEAFSYGLPVIAYRVDGIPELVTHNVDGLLFDVGDKQAMALGIISLLLDSKVAMEMGRLGRDKIEDNFLLEKMVNEHNSFFIKLKK